MTHAADPQERPGVCTERPCRSGDHYGQCWDVTGPVIEHAEGRTPDPSPGAGQMTRTERQDP